MLRQASDLLLALAAVECHVSASGPGQVPPALLRDLVIMTARLAGRTWLAAKAGSVAAFTELQATRQPPPLAELDGILAGVLMDRFGLHRPKAAQPGDTADTGSGRLRPAAQTGQAQEVINQLARSLFDVGALLKAVVDLPGDAARRHITEALARLDDVVQQAQDHVSAERSRETAASLAGSPLQVPRRLQWSADRAALLRERMAQTVWAVHRSASETVGLLEQRIEVVSKPGPIDYRTEIKRWQAFADQAEQMANHLDQEP